MKDLLNIFRIRMKPSGAATVVCSCVLGIVAVAIFAPETIDKVLGPLISLAIIGGVLALVNDILKQENKK